MNFSSKPVLMNTKLSILAITFLVFASSTLIAGSEPSALISAVSDSGEPATLSTGEKAESESLWLVDFDMALTRAKMKNLPILVDFSGSDWCKWCIMLDQEVFQNPVFKTWAKKNVVMCLVDMPQNRALLTEEQFNNNVETSKQYNVEGYPTILLLDEEGNEFARTGYRQGGPETYITHLEELLSNRGWEEKLTKIDELEEKDQIALSTYILNNQINNLNAADGTKIATVLFTKLEDDESPEKTNAATVLALDDSEPAPPQKTKAIKWMKERAANGDKKPYGVYLFIRNSIDFAKLGQLIQENKGAILTSVEVKESAEALLSSIKTLEEYMDDPMMKKQVDTRKILALGAIGKTEEALKLVDVLFAFEPNGIQMTEQLKTYIRSIK
jgi:thioredoxin-related protein